MQQCADTSNAQTPQNLSLKKQTLGLTLGALGVVYGDIGTSPLYALRETLHGLSPTSVNIYGVLSLIFWALVLVISIRYLFIILRADNKGEGGVLALFALLNKHSKKNNRLFFLVAVIGAGLLIGEGLLTPAISVLSAVEGLKVISPALVHGIIPLTLLILLLLFWQQHHGSGKLGYWFGPIILLWFLTLGVLGVLAIVKNPAVLQAANPHFAIDFCLTNGRLALTILGGVFLVVTGGEALYADMGHFGRLPIQLGWFGCALPGLVLNYFGQGALLLQKPEALSNPFYALAPTWFLYPLLILAMLATVIASQAVISATFSLTKQAILLNLLPKMRMIQTSATQYGQIYVPLMNILLAVGTILLVVLFQSASALTSAYGIAVNLVMLAGIVLVTFVARQLWQWSWPVVILLFGLFLIIDSLFLMANLLKLKEGGWIPLAIASVSAIIMLTWHRGMQLIREVFHKQAPDLIERISYLERASTLQQVPDMTAIFVTSSVAASSESLLHYLKLNHSLPEQVILLSIMVDEIPYVTDAKRFEFQTLAVGIYHLVLHYGFMQTVDIPEAFEQANKRVQLPIRINGPEVTYFTETKHIMVTQRRQKHMMAWQKHLFAYLQYHALRSPQFYQLPLNRTLSIGVYYEI